MTKHSLLPSQLATTYTVVVFVQGSIVLFSLMYRKQVQTSVLHFVKTYFGVIYTFVILNVFQVSLRHFHKQLKDSVYCFTLSVALSTCVQALGTNPEFSPVWSHRETSAASSCVVTYWNDSFSVVRGGRLLTVQLPKERRQLWVHITITSSYVHPSWSHSSMIKSPTVCSLKQHHSWGCPGHRGRGVFTRSHESIELPIPGMSTFPVTWDRFPYLDNRRQLI